MADGKTRVAKRGDLVPGAILRETSRLEPGVSPQFADSVLVKFDGTKNEWTLARPHMTVSSTGSWYVGVEEYRCTTDRLAGEDSIYRLVTLDRGNAANVAR